MAWLPDIIPTLIKDSPLALIEVYTTEPTYVLDMGIIRGAELRAVLLSPFGDPVAYAVKNTMIALRKRDSSEIFVRWRHE